MRPHGYFEEYKEFNIDSYLRFEGKLKQIHKNLPKAQLPYMVFGGDGFRDYVLEIDGLKVKGIIYKFDEGTDKTRKFEGHGRIIKDQAKIDEMVKQSKRRSLEI